MQSFTVTFSINFPYKGENFAATVYRYHTNPVQYLVMIDMPNDLNIAVPLILTANLQSGALEYRSSDGEILHPIAIAISNYCSVNAISLVD